MIDLSQISSWIWMIGLLLIVFLVLRYFSHILVHLVHFVISFFWHGCATAVVILAIYFVLRALHIL
jgi:hypothetical protein